MDLLITLGQWWLTGCAWRIVWPGSRNWLAGALWLLVQSLVRLLVQWWT